MKKSFKKAVAVLLTVLMATLSMPLSAFAYLQTDTVPDLNFTFRFGLVSDAGNSGDFFDQSISGNSLGVDYATSGIFGPALDYNKENGTLSFDASKVSDSLLAHIEMTDDYEGDRSGVTELGDDDVFTATAVLKGELTTLDTLVSYIQWSSNIEPVFFWASGTKKGAATGKMGTLDEFNADNSKWKSGIFNESGTIQIADDLYNGVDASACSYGLDLYEDGESKYNHCMYITASQSAGESADITHITSGEEGVTDPSTGDVGYEANGEFLVATFAFKIIDASEPIQFRVYDETSYINNENLKFLDTDADVAQKAYATYDEFLNPATGQPWVGSQKISFMADEEETPVETKYTVTYLDENGNSLGTEEVKEGEAPANVPALPAGDAHTTYGWNGDTTAAITAATTFTRTKTTTDHNYVEQSRVPANCVDTGSVTLKCSICNDEKTEVLPVDSTNHKTVVTDAAVAATCTTSGLTEGSHCSACNTTIVAQQTVEALGHNFGEWQDVEGGIDATCTEDGVTGGKIRYCSRCDATETQEGTVIPALGHDFVAGTVVPPTCTEGGYTVYTCSRCDATENRDATEALGHDYVPVVTAPTCTEQGYTTWTCSRCGDVKVDSYTDALGHTPAAAVEENRVEASCTEDGSYDEVVYCSVCHAEISREKKSIDALGHDFGEWQDVEGGIDATCTEDGMTGGKIRYCSRCDATETQGGEKIPALGHDFVAGTVVAPTCTEDGYTVYTCSRCDATENRDATPALGHTPAAAVEENRVEATCTEDGSYDEVVYCSVCDAEISRDKKTIDALGHDLGAWVETKAPTCTDKGEEKATCSRCDYFETRETDALGHTWGEWVVTTEPTKENKGTETRECSVCHATETREIDAIGVKITVPKSDLGTVTGAVDAEKDYKYVPYGQNYKLTAEANDNAEFVGWEINNKLVSKSKTYSNVAYTDLEIRPVFVEKEQQKITVVFYDKYGNIIKHFDNVTVDEYQAAVAEALPVAPQLQGYTFTGWDKEDDEIKSLTESATIWGQYERDTESTGYTVTVKADGEDITDNDGVLKTNNGTENGSIPFDTKVTVTVDGATAFKIGDKVVGYGSTYEFFIGSNVEITAVTDDVEVTPEVVIVGADKVAGTTNRFSFTATMNVATSDIADRGWIYGKNITDDMLADIDNYNTSKVRVTHNDPKSSSSKEFGLVFTNKSTGTFKARAYITLKNGTVVYSDVFTYEAVVS